jgi:NADPH-dependent 2,4-dienoyl-CoA reductase/sulfur reductase-like enzyme
MPKLMEPMSYPEGWKIYLAEEIKKAVKVPVIGVGVIRTPAFAEKILRERRIDFVALGRALMADPHWPNKASEGRSKDIIRCISCNIGCIGGRVFRGLPIRCSVNPATGREREFAVLPPAGERKKVLVVGGGPAGMEAACLAKKRGHRVILAEKGDKLGGQLLLAAVPPGKEKINWYSEYLIGRMKKLKVTARLKQEVTAAYVQKLMPDVVLLATGAVPWTPDIPGIQKPNVVKAWDILKGKKKIEDSMVVVAGGGTVGCETALYLARQNRKVIVVEMLDRIALDMEPINRMDLQEKIRQAGVDTLVKKKMKEIAWEGVLLEDEGGKVEWIRADWVILALGVKPNDWLFRKLKGKVPEIYSIGDCKKTGKIIDASYDGFRVGRLI